jgi:hypothetical protein
MAELQSSKLTVRVRFPSAALEFQQVNALIDDLPDRAM